MQLGQATQVAQYVAVEDDLVQIWTPAAPEPETVQSLTSCSMQGQLLLEVLSFHTHSRGGPVRQAVPASVAQTGRAFWQSDKPVQVTPPQCSAETDGGVPLLHCVSSRNRGPMMRTLSALRLNDGCGAIGITHNVSGSRAQRKP